MPINKLKHPERDYFQGWNETAQNKELSYAALGLHTYLLSLPEDWEVIRSALQREGSKKGKIGALIAELVEHGLLHHVQTRDENGKLSNSIYWIYARATDNPHYEQSPLTEIQATANTPLQKKEVKKESIKDSLPSKSTEDVTPDAPISDAKKKGVFSRSADLAEQAQMIADFIPNPKGVGDTSAPIVIEGLDANGDYQTETIPDVDWQAKILATLTDEWMASRHLESLLDVAPFAFAPLEFSEHPAAIVLYALEAERKVEFEAILGQRRRWRLHSDYGQPEPKSDEDLLMATIERCLKVHNGSARHLTHMLRGTSKTGIYGEEAEHFKDNPVTADELEGMVDYWIERYPDIHLLKKPAKISSEMAEYRIHKAAAGTQPEPNWDVQPEEPEALTFVDWGKDES